MNSRLPSNKTIWRDEESAGLICAKCLASNPAAARFCLACEAELRPFDSTNEAASEPAEVMRVNGDAVTDENAAPMQSEHPSDDPLIGSTIANRYLLKTKLGAGGMGAVYRATRVAIGDEVAVKILHAEQNDPHAVQRFRREAQAAARLKHPNAVSIYDFGVSDDGLQYLVMESVEGESLGQIIARRGPLNSSEVVEIISQVCEALDEAHRQNIIHRDIKPDNIIVHATASGFRVKVLDFGIAKLRDEVTSSLTLTGNVIGTPYYMSPEQCLGEELDNSSDVYSLGIVIYEMLTGRVPFGSPVFSAVIVQHVNQPPPPLRSINSNILPGVEDVVLRALSKDREGRPQTAGVVAIALAAAVRDTSASAESCKTNISIGESGYLAEEKPVADGKRKSSALPLTVAMPSVQSAATLPNVSRAMPGDRRFASGINIVLGAVILASVVTLIGWGLSRSWKSQASSPNTAENESSSDLANSTGTRISNAAVGLQNFEFETVVLDERGNVERRQKNSARSLAEDLGNGISLDMVAIPPGEFMMGSPETESDRSPNEGPQHRVKIAYSFYIGKFEITQAQWRAIMGTNPSEFKGCENCPVENVSWNDALEFCQRLSARAKRQYRLPTEAEWEYAARAGTTTPFAFGDTITPAIANYDGRYPYGPGAPGISRQRTVPVGSLGVANAFGLYDMSGNVSEWCKDWYHDSYGGGENAPTDGSAWLSGGGQKNLILRGGSWYNSASYTRSAERRRYTPGYSFKGSFGFRVVMVAGDSTANGS